MRCIAALLALFAGIAVGSDDLPRDTRPSPLAKPSAILAALRENDSRALRIAITGKPAEEIAAAWEEHRARLAKHEEPLARMSSPEEPYWPALLTNDGTRRLADEMSLRVPDLALELTAAAQEDPDGLADGIAAMLELPRDEGMRMQLLPAALAVRGWLARTAWTDRKRLERALEVAANFVRRTGMQSPAESDYLSYDEERAFLDGYLRTAKGMLLAYDFDVDALLASVRFEELWRRGDRAAVRWSAIVFGEPVVVTMELRWLDDCYWLCGGAKAGWAYAEDADDLEVERTRRR